MDTLFANYKALLMRVDARCREIEASLSGHMACARGCSSCCLNISLFPVEAVHLKLAFDALPAEVRSSILKQAESATSEGACPLLDAAGACQLYAHRPVICRTHGLPILFEDQKGEKRVDFCPQNFKGLPSLSGEVMLDVDTLNQMLAAINATFCHELFGDEVPFERLLISETLFLELS